MKAETLVDDAVTALELCASSEFRVELRERTGDPRTHTLSIARTGSDSITIHLASRDYVLSDLATTCIRSAALSPELSTTTVMAKCASGNDAGTMVITVDCGREPPTLAMTVTLADEQASCIWRIDHNIQHQILGLFEGVHINAA